jgi:23S rRNA (cytidine1920-2'-O)/16S rRNA (cytidine1409-2'-O)-methyltransferase
MSKNIYPMRLDLALAERAMVGSRTRADEYIKNGFVTVNARRVDKASTIVSADDVLNVSEVNPYVSRAALKMLSANKRFKIDFRGKVVLDVGSSTGGFTDYALKHGARKVIAVDVGTDQMHHSLREDNKVELYEKTDIRNVVLASEYRSKNIESRMVVVDAKIDVVVCDVSFISLRLIVPHLVKLMSQGTVALLMCKPQFEAGKENINKGVVKNEAMRRKILADFETYLKSVCVVLDKADSDTPGEKGNVERFFLVKPTAPGRAAR